MSLEGVELFFASNPNPMWIYNPENFEIVEVNEAATELYGYSEEEMLSMTIKDLRPQREVERLVQEVNKNVDELNKSGVWEHRTKEGEALYLEIISHPIKQSGTAYKLVTAIDITESTTE